MTMAKAKKTEATEATATEKPVKKVAKPKAEKPTVFKSVHADEPKREVVWNERRVAVVKAMRKLGAVSVGTAVTAGAIAKAAGIPDDEVFRVKIVLDVYRTSELTHNGFAKSVRPEGSRELAYYLTAKGKDTDFPVKE
jgi:hypothetical protein